MSYAYAVNAPAIAAQLHWCRWISSRISLALISSHSRFFSLRSTCQRSGLCTFDSSNSGRVSWHLLKFCFDAGLQTSCVRRRSICNWYYARETTRRFNRRQKSTLYIYVQHTSVWPIHCRFTKKYKIEEKKRWMNRSEEYRFAQKLVPPFIYENFLSLFLFVFAQRSLISAYIFCFTVRSCVARSAFTLCLDWMNE